MSFDLNQSFFDDDNLEDFSGNCSPVNGVKSPLCNGVDESESAPQPSDGSNGFSVKEADRDNNGDTEEEFRSVDDSVAGLLKQVEERLEVGGCVDTLEDVYLLYCEYGRLMGFSVKKGSNSYFTSTSVVRAKAYHCSCEGYPDTKRSCGRIPSYTKQTVRSNCKARLRVCREEYDAPWKVTVFAKQHNHELVDPSESYLLRSARNVSDSQKNLMMAMTSSGIGVSCAYRFVEKEAGSRENVGFLPKDLYNEINRDRKLLAKVKDVDANKLYEYLTQKGLTDPSFYWKLKVCDNGRLENLFFRDSRCLIDYQHFGDVVSVDSTYKTNKYGLICVPFIGINHHRTNVMFAIAFLSNEKSESYEWLFRTFLEAMYEKEPCVIFSDQDQALMNGVDMCFRVASHRLCQWHINKNAVKHFGRLNGNKEFKSLWYRCMNGCESDEQFEICWKGMIDEYNLSENRWFSNMYALRRRWSSAFTGEKFCGGLHATSRSEVTNKVLKDLCSGTSSVIEFVVAFERMQRSWRRREFEEDSHCHGMPGMLVHRSDILLQVAELCTRNVFKSFEYEALHSIEVKLTYEPPDMNDEVLEFKVSSRTSVTGYRVVRFNQRSQFAKCSCHMWESEGVLCRHLFRVFFHMNLDKIPDHLILNRWRRDCKQRHATSEETGVMSGVSRFSNMVFVNHHTKIFYDLLTECKDEVVCREAINEYMRNVVDRVKNLKRCSQANSNAGAFDATCSDALHRPLRNPKMKEKKRAYRRHKFRRNLDPEGRGRDESLMHGNVIDEDVPSQSVHFTLDAD